MSEIKKEQEVKTEETKKEEVKVPKHPKLNAALKALPGALWNGAKKLVGAVIAIGGGIVLGSVVLNTFGKPKTYATRQLLPDDEVETVDAPFTETETKEE